MIGFARAIGAADEMEDATTVDRKFEATPASTPASTPEDHKFQYFFRIF